MNVYANDLSQISLVILGGGGHAAVVAECAIRAGFRVHAVASRDRLPTTASGPFAACTWLGDPENPAVAAEILQRVELGARVHAAVGDGALRERWARAFDAESALASIIDPSAHVSKSAELGAGVFVGTGAIVHARARISRLAIVNTRAVVEHDCVVQHAAHIAPAAVLCGGVHVGARAQIGAGAVLIPGIRVGDDAVVGAGAVVVRDVEAGATVAGVPAKPLR
ncbi:MAG: NeuD/PglB/VioB family sugar acetyltransferase [Limnohabitans sp.]|jgi:UDP-perosamine 4-acetyltransferase|nr:NeuD/PglB/VioB family sugar acetyltransferase [Limnohabitans sp.]